MERKESLLEWIAAIFMILLLKIGIIVIFFLIAGIFYVFTSIIDTIKPYWIHIIIFTLFGIPIINWIYGLFKKEEQ